MPGDNAVRQTGYDPWWFTEQAQASSNPENAIIWACMDGEIYRSTDLGKNWILTMPDSDPPNSWGDDPAPTVEDLVFVQRTDNIHKHRHHYFLATWQNGSNEWRSWLLMTQDDGQSWTWKNLAGVNVDENGYIYPIAMKGWKAWDDSPAHYFEVTSGQYTATGEADGEYMVMTYYKDTPPDPGSSQTAIVLFDFGTVISGVKKMCIRGYKTGTLSNNFSNGVWTADPDKWVTAYNTKSTSGWGYIHGASPVWKGWLGSSCPVGAPEWYHMYTSINGDNFRYFGLTNLPRYDMWADGSKWYLDTVRIEASISLTEYKGVWMDVDSQSGDYLYVTAWKGDDTLVLQKRNTSDLTVAGEVSLGACTSAQLGSDCIAYPYTPTFNADRVYVFGRMNAPGGLANPEHLIQSVDGGTTFTSIENALGASLVTNFRAEGVSDGSRDFLAIVSNASAVPKFYKGTETLSEISTLSDFPNGLVNVDAFTVRVDPETGIYTIAVGSPSANPVMVVQSEDGGASWADLTLNLATTGEIKSVVFV